MAGEVIEVLETTSNINWTVVWAILAGAVPFCLAAMATLIKIFGAKKASEEYEIRLANIQKTVDENKMNCEKLRKEIESKSEKGLEELKASLHADKKIIDEIKTEITKLDKELLVLQTEQGHNAESFHEIKESYRDMANKLENLVQKMIEFLASE